LGWVQLGVRRRRRYQACPDSMKDRRKTRDGQRDRLGS
jgi:hypothetical protein